MKKKITVAIDGPAASGKSTTAKLIANQLGLIYIDSGAMYRAVTLKCLQLNVDVQDVVRVAGLAASCHIEFKNIHHQQHVFLDHVDITSDIRLPEISRNISPVAANPGVRVVMVRKQQEFGEEGNIIMDGRDIGTVVFPNADIKIFLNATPQARARRRLLELEKKGIEQDLDQLTEEIRRRDQADYSRETGPLKKAIDAIEVDNSAMTIKEQVSEIIRIIVEKAGS